jgi:acetyl esterase/lipase
MSKLKNKMNKVNCFLWRAILLFLLLLGMATSCAKRDFRQFEMGSCYVVHDSLHDMVICIDSVSRTTISGRWYTADSALTEPEPHYFKASSGMGHMGRLWSDSTEVKAIVEMVNDTLVLEIAHEGTRQGFRFAPLPLLTASEIEANYPYRDSLYEVACDRNIEYAKAFGFWESYSEPEDRNDYLSIVLDKMNFDDLTKKDLPLMMDVYYPVADTLTQRPLLMLIHGGAFFNGDKDSEAFVKWSKHFASMGYVVANINYRIGFIPVAKCNVERAGYRAVQDAYAAMCYMINHGDDYHIDPNMLFVGGSSAGGITALNLAFMNNKNRPQSTKGYILDVFDIIYDLGDINAVTRTQDDRAFGIKAVVNMWGAVHDTCMLKNSMSTAILSFHGDADSVVAYGYDYPFNKVKTPARDFVDSVAEVAVVVAPDYASLVRKAQAAAKLVLRPANQLLCDKMYGSQCVDQQAKALGMCSELHTVAGGGHSLHVNDDDGSLSDYFRVITDTTTQFLYRQIVPRPMLVEGSEGRNLWYRLENTDNVLTCYWEAVGGVVLQTEFDRVRVLFFSDAVQRELRVYGKLKGGGTYLETYECR